jgi:hypothetical protein
MVEAGPNPRQLDVVVFGTDPRYSPMAELKGKPRLIGRSDDEVIADCHIK